jgi:hypothetical protein
LRDKVVTLDLTDDEKLSRVELPKRGIGDDPYPLSPRIRTPGTFLRRRAGGDCACNGDMRDTAGNALTGSAGG